jgi:hypothetical protein
MTSLHEQREAERLLERIRARVAELHRLELARAGGSDLRQRRREITRLQWQLARLVSRRPGDSNLAA